MSIEKLYQTTMGLLVLHQIDAAYWHEWEMFNLPGGIQGFLVFNLVALALLLHGHQHVILKTHRRTVYSKICAGLGIATFLIHAGFAVFGFTEFHLPLSVVIIALCLMSGLGLLMHTVRLTKNA